MLEVARPWNSCPGRTWILPFWRHSKHWVHSSVTCSGWPCLARGSGVGDLYRSLPNPTALWFCEDIYHFRHFKSHWSLLLLLKVQTASFSHIPMKICLPIHRHIRDLYIYMEMDTNSTPSLCTDFFFHLPWLRFGEAAPVLCCRAPGASLWPPCRISLV